MPCEACAEEARQGAAVEPFDVPFPVDEYPDRAAFERPAWLQPGQGLTVTDDGHVAGYFFQTGACLVHDHGACPRPSPTAYAAFHQQQVTCADGEPIRVGAIGMVGGHADPYASIDVAQAHYADPSRQRVLCRAGDDEHGGWIAGVLVPGLTFGDVAEMRACALSGDWRPMPSSWWKANRVGRRAVLDCEGYDCIGPTFVNRPGLPLVQRFEQEFVLRSGETETRAAALLGGMGGIQLDDETEDTVPTPTTTRIAASPPPPPSGGNGGPPEAKAPTLDALDARVAALEDAMQQCVDWINQQQSNMAASVRAKLQPLPEPTEEQLAFDAMLGATFSRAERDKMAGSGAAMPDGSFPIRNQADLENAIHALGRSGNPDAVKAHLKRRAASLGLTGWLKEHTSWAGVAA